MAPGGRSGRDRQKFDRVPRFGRALPGLRAQVDRDLRRRRLSRDRVAACVVRLIDLQFFRVGNPEYAKRNQSYGITTLREEHAMPGVSIVEFDFVGKSGKRHRRRVREPRIARVIAKLLEIPGSEVFRFFDEDGLVHTLRSRDVNAYVKRHMGEEFTAKDFRTWGGTSIVATSLIACEPSELDSASGQQRVLREAIREAAAHLGNTASVTRSAYVDPLVLAAAERPDVVRKVRRSRARMRSRRYLTVDEQATLALIAAMRRASRRKR